MRIVLVLKPYAIEVYSYENSIHTLVGIENTTRIEDERMSDYEKRMIFVCKDLCSDMRASPFFKAIAKKVDSIDIILCSPWCTYEVLQVKKDLEKPTKIDSGLLESMYVRKSQEDVCVIESYTSNILLNGYTVTEIKGQTAQSIQFQYVHVYGNRSFTSGLVKAIESVFHTHKVTLSSIYGLTEKIAAIREQKSPHEMRIILEEESIDISYVADGLHVVNMFVPYSYKQLEDDIAMKLSADHSVICEMLQSRYESTNQEFGRVVSKNSKKLWPDLDIQTKKIVDACIQKSTESILKSIRDCIDTITAEYIKDSIVVRIYCLHRHLVSAYGEELGLKIHTDPYITMKIHIAAEAVYVENIF